MHVFYTFLTKYYAISFLRFPILISFYREVSTSKCAKWVRYEQYKKMFLINKISVLYLFFKFKPK